MIKYLNVYIHFLQIIKYGGDSMKILVVEDDTLLNRTLSYNLTMEGYLVDSALTQRSAEDFIKNEYYDLIVLDINLPDGNGFEICKRIKSFKTNTAIIFLTANDMESDMLKGYELGADDYVTKPFPISVFQKKVSRILSHVTNKKSSDYYDDGKLSINFSEMTATLEDAQIIFTPMEYRLLKILINNPRNVLTRQVLLEKIWDINNNFVDEHTLTVIISRIRNKIETNNTKYIKTVYGMGYMWIGGMKDEETFD